jgi:hypothetical protein
MIKNIVALVIYSFACGTFFNHIANNLKIKGSITRKYIDIICDIFIDEYKLFNQCINIPFIYAWLENIISNFKAFIGLPNVFDSINRTRAFLY